MRVVVAGAGLAGLAVATGLARAGHEVRVFEADPAVDARPQGYRLHLDRRGLDALRWVLPEASWALAEATSGQFEEPHRLEVRTGRLHLLRSVATGPGEVDGRIVSTAVDRGTLRSVLVSAALAAGVEICWAARVSGFVESADQVRLRMADDQRFPEPSADLLVACDGARSAVAVQRLPDLVVRDTGARSIVGRTPLEAAPSSLSRLLTHGYVVLRGLRTGVGLGRLQFRTPPGVAGASAGVPLPDVANYVMWNVGLTAGARIPIGGPEVLRHSAVRRLRSWHRDVRSVVADADPEATFLAPALVAQRPRAWAPSRVTVIGDAAHVMPADRGSGANLALADAARLVDALAPLVRDSGRSDLLEAVGRAERAMVEEAFAVNDAGPTISRR